MQVVFPSPFFFLDEVDSALDQHNASRMVQYLLDPLPPLPLPPLRNTGAQKASNPPSPPSAAPASLPATCDDMNDGNDIPPNGFLHGNDFEGRSSMLTAVGTIAEDITAAERGPGGAHIGLGEDAGPCQANGLGGSINHFHTQYFIVSHKASVYEQSNRLVGVCSMADGGSMALALRC